jgi:hypothetical protein
VGHFCSFFVLAKDEWSLKFSKRLSFTFAVFRCTEMTALGPSEMEQRALITIAHIHGETSTEVLGDWL